MTSKERLAYLLRAAIFEKTLYNSDDEPIETFEVRAVADELVVPLAAFLDAHGVLAFPCKESDT